MTITSNFNIRKNIQYINVFVTVNKLAILQAPEGNIATYKFYYSQLDKWHALLPKIKEKNYYEENNQEVKQQTTYMD